MSAATPVHIPVDELARFATTRQPDSWEFDSVRDHLAEGCKVCSQLLGAYRSAGADRTLPPLVLDWIVPRRISRGANTRAGVLADHQLVCGAGNYELDVIVRELDAPHRLEIGGQVTQARALYDPAPDVPLFLLEARGDSVVSTTRTDEFGEFDFSTTNERRYGLRVGDQIDAPCVLVWDGAA